MTHFETAMRKIKKQCEKTSHCFFVALKGGDFYVQWRRRRRKLYAAKGRPCPDGGAVLGCRNE